MDTDSTNVQPPALGPQFPVYPELPQLCRVTAPSGGQNIYPALVQQFTPPLGLRDREPCFVWEPNGVTLGPFIYDCRLVGSYLGLPLFVTNCCLSGGFSSSSAGG
jgi:hypothetical protein